MNISSTSICFGNRAGAFVQASKALTEGFGKSALSQHESNPEKPKEPKKEPLLTRFKAFIKRHTNN